MSDLFSWFGDIISWLGQFIPRLVIIRSTHRGLKFKRGTKLVEASPGLCVYWPLLTEFELIAAARQPLNLPIQRLVTLDDRRVICSGVVVYRIRDVVRTLGKNFDHDATIRDISMGVIAEVVTKHQYQYIRNMDDTTELLTGKCREALRKYGIQVQKCMLTDFCPANVISLANDPGVRYEQNDQQ